MSKQAERATLTHTYVGSIDDLLSDYRLDCGGVATGPFGRRPIRDVLDDVGRALEAGKFLR